MSNNSQPPKPNNNFLKAENVQTRTQASAGPQDSRVLPLHFNQKPSAFHQGPSSAGNDGHIPGPGGVRITIPKSGALDQSGLASKTEELARKEIHLGLRTQEVAQKQKNLEEKLDGLNRLIANIERTKVEELHNDEHAIIALSLKIAEKVLQHEIENGRYRIGEAVKSALQAVRDKGVVAISVNPRDYETVKEAVEKHPVEGLAGRVTLKSDPAVAPASCVVETDSGKISSEVFARLQMIEKSLLTKNGEPREL
jgi:flagellar biosynthesis/type III secretory pathway protein FliH